MRPRFNTTGPCFPDEHYMLPPERRLGRVMDLIEDGRDFTLHAGRQTGKTTSAQWLVDHYNAGERYCALWVDLQVAREKPEPESAFRTILNKLDDSVRSWLPALGSPAERGRLIDDPSTAVLRYLRDLAARAPHPLVVMFDEADCLVGAAMISFLTQLRCGYFGRRNAPFPLSVALIGQRTVPDDFSAEALTLAAFTEPDVAALCAQHTATTGQPFEPAAIARIFELSLGHSWLVNALADQIVDQDLRDRSAPVTAAHVDAAKETIIRERRSHLDSLFREIRAPRVRRILDPIVTGTDLPGDVLDDDVMHLLGLGILRLDRGGFVVANPIYREALPRALP